MSPSTGRGGNPAPVATATIVVPVDRGRRTQEVGLVKYVALYRVPDDVAAFDDAYFRTHVPLANATPGLVRTELARVVRHVRGEPAYHLIAELYFESSEAMRAAFKTDEWQASGANLAEWGGLELVTMFTAQLVDDSGAPV